MVCVPVPASTPLGGNQELVLLHESDDGDWRVLESAGRLSGYDPGDGNRAVCGATKSFSRFGAAVVDVVADGGPGVQVFMSDDRSYAVKLTATPDGEQPRVTWPADPDADLEDLMVHVPPQPRIAGGTVRVLAAIDLDVVGGFAPPAVVCVPVPTPATLGDDQELVLLHESDAGVWRVLESADRLSGYDPGAGNIAVCGLTDSFSAVFGAAVVDVVAGGTGAIERISRIEPSIRSVTIYPGDAVLLSFDVYGRQEILDNALGEGHEFAWEDGGAGGSFAAADRSNEVVYTAPESPGTHVVTATSPDGSCLTGEDADETLERCTAKFTITVRRPSAALEERPAPENPVGEIPSVLVDAEGRRYEVFTPVEGGSFDGEDVTISAGPGVVPNLEVVGVRADAGGAASNAGRSDHRYSLAGMWHEIRAIDADESPVSGYVLQSPLEVCLPLPDVLRSNIPDVAVVASKADGSLAVLSSSVGVTASGTRVCGGLSELPASVAVGRPGSPADLPTPTPSVDEAGLPDTGGFAPRWLGLVLLMGLGFVVVAVPFAVRARR